jgi:hypothetical protein
VKWISSTKIHQSKSSFPTKLSQNPDQEREENEVKPQYRSGSNNKKMQKGHQSNSSIVV